MTAQTVEINDLACGRCGMTTDLCLSMRDDCCVGCTHYPEPVDNDIDEVAVARAVAGDLSVSLNRHEAAEAHRRLHDAGLSIKQIAERLGTTERTADRWNQGHTRPITRRGRTMSDTIDTLLAEAQRHPAKRVKNAAARANAAVQRVRDLLAEDAGKAEARERVERLERELREAKAALRGKPTTVASTAPMSIGRAQTALVDGGIPCPNGCGKVSLNAAGAASHVRFCKHVAEAS